MSVQPEQAVDEDNGRGLQRGRRVALSAAGLLGAGVLAFGVLAPPEVCPQPTAASLDESAGAAVQWVVRNQQPDGTWLYEYDTDHDTDMGGYNLVRHAGANTTGRKGLPKMSRNRLAWGSFSPESRSVK